LYFVSRSWGCFFSSRLYLSYSILGGASYLRLLGVYIFGIWFFWFPGYLSRLYEETSFLGPVSVGGDGDVRCECVSVYTARGEDWEAQISGKEVSPISYGLSFYCFLCVFVLPCFLCFFFLFLHWRSICAIVFLFWFQYRDSFFLYLRTSFSSLLFFAAYRYTWRGGVFWCCGCLFSGVVVLFLVTLFGLVLVWSSGSTAISAPRLVTPAFPNCLSVTRSYTTSFVFFRFLREGCVCVCVLGGA